MAKLSQLRKAAQIIIKDCLAVKKGEKVVVITDEFCREVAYSLLNSLIPLTDPILIEIIPRKMHGQEPPGMVAEILKRCDVFIIPTSCSLTHTKARITASKLGARGATMPGITAEVMQRTLNTDYKKIARLAKKLALLLTRAKMVYVKTEKGTDIKLELGKRPGYADTGIIHKPCDFSNLPAGEAYIAPIEYKAEGTIIVDGSFAPVGFLNKPVTLKIADGKILAIKGNNRLSKIFQDYGRCERVLCELGIGTNPRAIITGNVLEDEKVMGSCHFAFGNNLGFGGKNRARIHLDAVVQRPSIWLDGQLIINKGNFLG